MIPNGVRLCPPVMRTSHSWYDNYAGLCLQLSYKGRAGPVEPATEAKVMAPLEEGCCGWVGPMSTPRVNS